MILCTTASTSSLHRITATYLRCCAARASVSTSSCWISDAIRKIDADFQRSTDTHLIPLDLRCFQPNIHVYLKDESTHPTGSLKHRLARSLFLYSLCNGWLNAETTVIEASSGSTAVSEAYFARLLGLPFVAVVPSSTAASKLALIQFYGGQIHTVDRSDQIYAASRQLRQDIGNAHFMDQFTFAERATDWRSNNNIATSIFTQMKREPHPIPTWIIMSAGTSMRIKRYPAYCIQYFAWYLSNGKLTYVLLHTVYVCRYGWYVGHNRSVYTIPMPSHTAHGGRSREFRLL